MLHILLLILKILGIIVAAILGILVLLICIVLFVPIRYRASGFKKGPWKELSGRVKVTWLFGLLEFRMTYKNQKAGYRMRIAWKRIGSKENSSGKTVQDAVKKQDLEERGNDYEEARATESSAEEEPKEAKESTKVMEEAAPELEDFKTADEEISGRNEASLEKSREAGGKILESLWKRFKQAGSFFKGSYEKIKCTFRKLCDKIKVLCKKKDKLAGFIEDETHKKAFGIVKKEAVKLLRRFSPKRCRSYVRFGTGDPCITGRILAGIAAVYPFMPGDLSIDPEFDGKVLEFKADIKGSIFLVHLLICALQIIRRRAVRSTFTEARNIWETI